MGPLRPLDIVTVIDNMYSVANSIVPIGDGAGGGEGGNGNGGDNNTNNSSDSQVVASYDSRGKHIFVGNAKVCP